LNVKGHHYGNTNFRNGGLFVLLNGFLYIENSVFAIYNYSALSHDSSGIVLIRLLAIVCPELISYHIWKIVAVTGKAEMTSVVTMVLRRGAAGLQLEALNRCHSLIGSTSYSRLEIPNNRKQCVIAIEDNKNTPHQYWRGVFDMQL